MFNYSNVEKFKRRWKIFEIKCYKFWFFIERNLVPILLGAIATLLSLNIFFHLNYYRLEAFDLNNSLEIILTVNGLFSAILITYFFNQITQIWNNKKEYLEQAEIHSQKITEFRRVCLELTSYYGIWYNEPATKNLLDGGAYSRIDYFDYKLYSFSDYVPYNKDLIDELNAHNDYNDAHTDLYLGMVSLIKDRKRIHSSPAPELYGDYQVKGLYRFDFVLKCLEIGHFGRLWYKFDKDYHLINYGALTNESRLKIQNTIGRINSKYIGRDLNNSLMADVTNDLDTYHIKELYRNLKKLREGITGITLIVFIILLLAIIVGVIFPLIAYFLINNIELKTIITDLIIALNFGLLFFFITNLYGLIKREIVWS